MANIQLEAFGELFQSEIAKQRFQTRNYSCPFDIRISTCDKPNKGDLRYGNCSAQAGDAKRIICPRRFYEGNYRILKDIKEFIWQDNITVNCYDELKIKSRTIDNESFDYGSLDWILVNRNNNSDFCGVEIQTDATTGTGEFKRGIEEFLNNNLADSYQFGLNTLASFKGFLPQFIFKGQLFDDWKRPYCAVMQDELWVKFKEKFRIRYREISSYTTETFLFFVYSLEFDTQNNRYKIGNYKVYASRWIDLLFSFSVESKLLLDLNDIKSHIERKIERYSPIISI